MKKIKLFTLLVALICVSSTSAFAQLTTGSSSASQIRTGNRPGAGDYGIFIGASTTDLNDCFDDDTVVVGVPLVNFKYYATNNLEYRLGLELSSTKQKVSGDLLLDDDSTSEMKYKSVERTRIITPGIAYHFSDRNLLDVYVGANLPIGTKKYQTLSEGDDYSSVSTRSPFIIGLGGYIGLQAFVADLPLSLGLEYGISYYKQYSNKTKTVTEIGSKEQTIYTVDSTSGGYDFSDSSFEKLSSSRSVMKNEVRVTLTYYFKL